MKGFPIGFIVAFICLFGFKFIIQHYPGFRSFIADLIFIINNILGGLFKILRKKSVEYKYTSYIDRARNSINDSSLENLLPKCKVNWVSLNTAESCTNINESAIICIHIDKNFNLNIFNALHYYINSSLLPDSEPFMHEQSLRAIRLMALRIIALANTTLLSFFNKLFRNQTPEVQASIRKIDEINRCGFYSKILLPSLTIWTEKILAQLPDEMYKEESDSLIEWLYYNSIEHAEDEEKFHFKFVTQNIKLALIVIANDAYFAERSYWPYIRRVHTYASKRYDSIFIVSLGIEQGQRANILCDILLKDDCFSKLSKYTQSILFQFKSTQATTLTCIALKPNYDNLIEKAWRNIISAYKQHNSLRVFVSNIHKTGITVNFEGVLLEVYNDQLSEETIANYSLYFQRQDVLDLRILNLDEQNKLISLSNIGSETDPVHVIRTFKNAIHNKLSGKVLRFEEYDGIEVGAFIGFKDVAIEGHLTKSNVTQAPLIKISEVISLDQVIEVYVINYDIERKRYSCRMVETYDPYKNEPPTLNAQYDLRIVSISENGLVCKMYNGLRAFIPVSMYSWHDRSKNRESIMSLKKGQLITAKLLAFEENHKQLLFSRRDAIDNDIQAFAQSKKGSCFSGIVELEKINSLYIRLENGILVYVPINKADSIKLNTNVSHIGELMKIKIIRYEAAYFDCVGTLEI